MIIKDDSGEWELSDDDGLVISADCGQIGWELSNEDGEMIKALAEANVVHIEYKNDVFILFEGCDYHFELKLTPEQLRCLGRELIEIADNVIDEAK